MQDEYDFLESELDKIIEQRRQEKQNSEAVRRQVNDADRKEVLANISKDLAEALKPHLEAMKKNSEITAEEMKRIISESVNIQAPNVDTSGIAKSISDSFGKLKFPEPKVNVETPPVVVPEIKVPTIRMPKIQFPDQMRIGNDVMNPIPVTVLNQTPATKVIGLNMADPYMDTVNNAIRANIVAGTLSATLTADYGSGEIGANTLRIVQATNAVSSVNLVGANVSLAAALVDSSGIQYSGSNPLPTTASLSATQNSGPVDATTLRVVHAVDVALSTNVIQFNGNTPAVGLNETTNGVLRVVMMTDATNSTNITQFNGNTPAVGLNETTNGVLRAVIMTDSVTSVNVTGVPQIQGDIASGSTDSASNPLKVGFVGKNTNTTAVSDGQRVNGLADLHGKQIVKAEAARELVTSANVLLTRGALTSVLTAAASTFIDLVMITGVNASTNAVNVLLYESDSGANVFSLEIPATDIRGASFQVPLPQTTAAQTWTAKVNGTDISDSNVNLFLQGIKNT